MKIHKDCKIELAASKDASRYSITEPYLDMIKEPVMVATNGAIIAVVPVETEEGDASGFVTAEALKAERKAKLGMICNGELKVAAGPTFPRPDLGQYPNWRQVIPAKDRESTFKVGLNVKMLWELCQAIGCETAQLEFANAEDGIIVKPTSVGDRNTMHPSKPAANPDSYGVIMPTRLV
jgi:hypothetical protein